MSKRIGILLLAALLLFVSAASLAEGGVNVEVIRMDGVSVIVLTPVETADKVRGKALDAMDTMKAQGRKVDFVLPGFLTSIEKSAFEGIAAESVEVSGNIAFIDEGAFASCPNLREIYIPETVVGIHDQALKGCGNVTVYGVKDSEAQRFAEAARFTFVDISAQNDPPPAASGNMRPPIELPPVKR